MVINSLVPNSLWVGLLCLFLTQNSYAENSIHLISVNGIAESSVEANLALIQLSLWGKAPVAKTAQELQAKQYEALKSLVEKFKIKKDDFKTVNYSFSPEYIYDQKTQNNKIVGYSANHHINIILKNVSEVGKFLDSLTQQTTAVSSATGGKESFTSSGALIQSISWDSDKKAEVEKESLATAVQAARTKAEALAKAAGVKIKAVHRIQYQVGSASPPVMMGLMSARMKNMAADSAPTELSAAGVKVQVEVQMDFEI